LKPDFSATIAAGIWAVPNYVLPNFFAAKKKGHGPLIKEPSRLV